MLVVVGGHSRNLGKTSVVAGLIRRLRDRQWTAVKITPHGHGICPRKGTACDCPAAPDHPFELNEEFEPSRTDSGRYLAAGARRSFLLRTPAGELARAAGIVQELLRQNENVIVESNSILELVQADVCLMLLDFSCPDFKASSLRFLDRADAFLILDRGINAPLWQEVAHGLWDAKPQFHIKPPRYVTAEIATFVAARL